MGVTHEPAIQRARRGAANARDKASSRSAAVIGAARVGYVARGFVYLVVGGLAFAAAIGSGGDTPGTRGALEKVFEQPAGVALVAALAVGLFAYSSWRFVQAFLDPEGAGTDAKGAIKRVGKAISGISHLALALFAVGLVIGWWGWGSGGSGGSGGESSADQGTAVLMGLPGGRWIVAAIGAIVIGVGVYHFVRAYNAKFEERLQLSSQAMRWASPVCRFGLAARGLVFLIIGGFLIVAAWRFASDEARGLRGALEALQSQPYGPYLLGIAGLGLVAFGIYGILEGIYRRLPGSGEIERSAPTG